MNGEISATRAKRRGWLAGIGMIALAACSSDGFGDLRPPADVGTHTASIEPAAEQSMSQTSPEEAASAEPQGRFESEPLPAAEPEMVETAPPMSTPADMQADMSDFPSAEEPEQPVVMGAPEQQLAQVFPPIENPARTLSDSEPEYSTQPQDDMGEPEAAIEPETQDMIEPEEPAAEPEIAPRQAMIAYPRIPDPTPVEPEPAPLRPRYTPLSSDELDCRKRLKKLGVRFVELKPIHDSPSCQIAHPVKLQAIGSVEMRPAATLTCDMAATFAAWTRNELVPASRWRFFSGIKTIHQGSAYSCRRIARSRTMSAHSQGNALDVMSITLNNGKKIDIKKQGLFAFRARGLLNNVRSDGCEYFSTVLGPGYNYDHRNHFHFDLMNRRSGRRACH